VEPKFRVGDAVEWRGSKWVILGVYAVHPAHRVADTAWYLLRLVDGFQGLPYQSFAFESELTALADTQGRPAKAALA
jgi:hypothetical protein